MERNILSSFTKTPAERSELTTELAEIAEEELPGLWDHNKAPEYREDVIIQFLENTGEEPREHGRSYSPDERRLLNAWTTVADEWGTSESNIRSCVLRMYEDADSDELRPIDEFGETTSQFLEHLREIEIRWERTKTDQMEPEEN